MRLRPSQTWYSSTHSSVRTSTDRSIKVKFDVCCSIHLTPPNSERLGQHILPSWKPGRENRLNRSPLSLSLADYVEIQQAATLAPEQRNCESALPVKFKMADGAQSFNI